MSLLTGGPQFGIWMNVCQEPALRIHGIEMKQDQVRVGLQFCDTAVELTDEATLARMWDVAENLPSLPELEEPRLWLARIA